MTSTTNDESEFPLCVDLDGTLVNTDTLVESIGHLIKSNCILLLLFPVWLVKGRPYFKKMIASHVSLDVEFLPFNEIVLAKISEVHADNRQVILCTGAHEQIAIKVADHLGVFDDVVCTTATENMTRTNKQNALVDRYGDGGYDFIGNDLKDLPAMKSARSSFLVRPTRGLFKARDTLRDASVLDPQPVRAFRTYASQIRVHQWLKNILLFLPLLAAQKFNDQSAVLACLIAFFAFGSCASSVYVLNDLMDLRADRRHPRKKFRPFASTAVPVTHGLFLIPGLLAVSAGLAIFLPSTFALTLLLYLAVSLIYNLWAKNVAVLDTIFLAGLYTVRILAGAAAIQVTPSFWLLAFSMFLFLSIALAKRYTELIELDLPDEQTVPGRQYRRIDLSTLISQGAASGYAAVLVLALYINSDEVAVNYARPAIIWLACPLLLYWINKLWLNTQRREMTDDPLIWAITNRVSRVIAVALVGLLLVAI